MANGRPTLQNIIARHNGGAVQNFIARQLAVTSPIFELMPFEASVTPPGRRTSRSLRYPYEMLKSLRKGQLRDWYNDYPTQFNEYVEADAYLRPIGDAFETDRAFEQSDPDYTDENVAGFASAITTTYSDLAINGDVTQDAREFNGASKILTGTSSEISGAAINLSVGQTDAQFYEALEPLKKYINRIKSLGLTPIVLANEDAALRMETVGLRLGFVQKSTNTFGADINQFGGSRIVDAGNVPSGVDGDFLGRPVIPVVNGLTDIYIFGLGLNGVHGVTLTGNKGVQYYNKDRSAPGVVLRDEAEIIAGFVIKDTRAAYVLRGVRVAPGA